MHGVMRLAAAMVVVFGLAVPAGAEVRLASIFTDNLVLQRDQPVPLWGWADPGEQVTVEFAGQKKTAKADMDGKWTVKLEAMKASDEPRELKVGGIVIHDVLVGDVWLIAGGADAAKRATDLEPVPNIRVFNVSPETAREPQPNVRGRWAAATGDSLKGLPAEAVLLGRTLTKELGVPVGIVCVIQGWPGYPVESWMSRESLAFSEDTDGVCRGVWIAALISSEGWSPCFR